METKYVLGIVALAMVALLGVGFVAAYGMGRGFVNSDFTDEEKAEFKEQREALKTAISEGDYETWKSLMEEKIAVMQSKITEENFNKIVEKHEEMSKFKEAVEELRESGDLSRETLQELKEEYGIEGFGRMKKRFRMGRHFGACPLAE